MNKQFLTFAAVVAGTSPAVSNAAVQLTENANTYTVKAGDSLYKIAKYLKRARQSDRSINDTMLALYHANPQAFAGSIDVLKSNAVLTLPNFAGVVLSSAAKSPLTQPVAVQHAAVERPSVTQAALLQENTRLKASLRQKNRLIAVLDTKLDQSRATLSQQANQVVTPVVKAAPAPAVPKPMAQQQNKPVSGFLASNTTWFIGANVMLLLLVFWLVYRLWLQHRTLQTLKVPSQQQRPSTVSSTMRRQQHEPKHEPMGQRLLRQTTSGYYEMLSFARPALSYFGMNLRSGYDAMFQVSHADTVSAFRKQSQHAY